MKTTNSIAGLAFALVSVVLARPTDAVGPEPAVQWARQLGTTSNERSTGISSDGLRNVYISGWTVGDLGGTNAGGSDAFVVKFGTVAVPEPSSLLLGVLARIGLLAQRRRQK